MRFNKESMEFDLPDIPEDYYDNYDPAPRIAYPTLWMFIEHFEDRAQERGRREEMHKAEVKELRKQLHEHEVLSNELQRQLATEKKVVGPPLNRTSPERVSATVNARLDKAAEKHNAVIDINGVSPYKSNPQFAESLAEREQTGWKLP